jgi:hypothetical protein
MKGEIWKNSNMKKKMFGVEYLRLVDILGLDKTKSMLA